VLFLDLGLSATVIAAETYYISGVASANSTNKGKGIATITLDFES